MQQEEKEIKRQFVSVDEFFKVTGQKPATVRKWIREKKIKAKKIGAIWLILKSELDFLLEEPLETKNKEEQVITKSIKQEDAVEEKVGENEPALIIKNDIEDATPVKLDTDFQELFKMLEKKMGKNLLQDKWQCYKDDCVEDDATKEDLMKLKKEFVLALAKGSKLI